MNKKQAIIQKTKEFFIEVSVLLFFVLISAAIFIVIKYGDREDFFLRPAGVAIIIVCVCSGIGSSIIIYSTFRKNINLRLYNYVLMKLPDDLRTPIQQYLLFFKDYVRDSRLIEIDFDVFKVENGIAIRVKNSKSFPKEKFQNLFKEYISFLENAKIQKSTNFDANTNLFQRLELEIDHLKKHLELLHSKIELDHFEKSVFGDNTITFLSDKNGEIGRKLISSGNITSSNFKQEKKRILKEKISKANISQVMDELIVMSLTMEEKRVHNDLVLLKNQYEENTRNSRVQLESRGDIEIRRNRIVDALIHIIDELFA